LKDEDDPENSIYYYYTIPTIDASIFKKILEETVAVVNSAKFTDEKWDKFEDDLTVYQREEKWEKVQKYFNIIRGL
jgi:hypothetical protein